MYLYILSKKNATFGKTIVNDGSPVFKNKLLFHYRIAPRQNLKNKSFSKSHFSINLTMKKVLLVGRQLTNIPPADKIPVKNIKLFAASSLAEVNQVFANNKNVIDIVIMGAGIELESRLEIVRYIFNTSNTTTVHMKDWATGPEGFLPFINLVLNGLLPENK